MANRFRAQQTHFSPHRQKLVQEKYNLSDSQLKDFSDWLARNKVVVKIPQLHSVAVFEVKDQRITGWGSWGDKSDPLPKMGIFDANVMIS